jgi:hypothetical protein
VTDSRDRMVLDFTKKISARLQEVLQLEMDLARAVFTGPECMAIMLEVASGMQCGAILYAVQASKPGTDPDFMYRIVSSAIRERVEQQRHLLPEALTKVDQLRRHS